MTTDDFSLMRGGPVYRLLCWLGMLRSRRRLAPLIACTLVGIAGLPLLVASAWHGTLLPGSVDMPLAGDAALQARLLLALPLLTLAAGPADRLLRAAIRQFSRAGLVSHRHRGEFDAILKRLHVLRDSHIPELTCLLAAFAPALLSPPVLTGIAHLDGWYAEQDGAPTAAAYWAWWVSIPVFRAVCLMWMWRFALWVVLLCRLACMGLDLRPPHPDGAGGLGFLGYAQQRFSALALAGGIVLSGSCINHVVHAGQTIHDLRHLLAAYVLGASAILLAPLLVLSPSLLRAKRHALSKYGALGHRAIRSFDAYWKKGQTRDQAPALLDSPQPSALADFGSVYTSLARMSVVPMNRWNVLWMLQAAALPLLPLVFFAFSVDDLVRRLVSILV